MKSKDIYIGTIKKCGDIYWYEKYGEERFSPDCVIGSTTFGRIKKYAEPVCDNAILIKVDDKTFIWIDMINSKLDEFLISLGIAVKTIKTYPTSSYSLYVDENSLKPYFNCEINNLRTNQVKELSLNLKNKPKM